MLCSEHAELLNRLLDGELSKEEASRLQAHLAECAACSSVWDAMQWVSSALESEPMAAPAQGFGARVIARIEAGALRQRRLYSIAGLSVAAVGLWMLAIVSILSLGTAAWPALLRSALFVAVIQTVRGTFDLVWVLAGALRSLGAVMCAHANFATVVAYATVAGIVVMSWMQIVLRRTLPIRLRI